MMSPSIEFSLQDAAIWALRLLVDNSLRYIIFAGIAWILAYDLFRTKWFARKVISGWPAAADVRREILHSAATILVYVVVSLLTIAAMHRGFGRMYFQIERYGWTWFVISIVLAIFLHDTWFYWTHRLIHHPRLFRRWHRIHHESRNPSPWAAYCFSLPEAAFQATIFPLVVALIPIHLLAFVLFLLWQITWNVIDHTGFEYSPRWLLKSRIGRLWNTPTAHVMHHEFLQGNYGLYFTIWDRLMGTLRSDYEQRFNDVTAASGERESPDFCGNHAVNQGIDIPRSPIDC